MKRNPFIFCFLALVSALILGGCLAKSTADEDYHPGIGIARLSASSTETFSTPYVGGSDEITLTVRNTGSAQATLLGGSFSSSNYAFTGGTFPGTGGNCGSTLNAGLSCTLTVTFSPISSSTDTGTATISFRSTGSSTTKTVTYTLSASGQMGTTATLDTQTFGSSGYRTNAIGSGVDVGTAIAVQSDGKIVHAGYCSNGSNNDFCVARYTTDGSLDTSFSSDGLTLTTVGSGHDRGYAVAIQSDGKIVVGGYSNDGTNNIFAVARYNTDGSLDTTFSSDGLVTTAIGTADNIQALAIQSDGKIVAVGYATISMNLDMAIVRYSSDGSLDTSFSGDGIVTYTSGNDYANGVAIQTDGKIVVVGTNTTTFVILRYNTDGSLDTTFSSDGVDQPVLGINSSYAYSVATQSDGKILVGGSYDDGAYDIHALVRYNTNGTLDTSFHTDGIVTTDLASYDDSGIYSIGVQSDGKIVTMGAAVSGLASDLIVARYTSTGTLDTTFDTDGIYESTLIRASGLSLNSIRNLQGLLQSDGKILVGGYYNNDFRILRLWP